MEKRNVFLYWVGKEWKLISILRKLIVLHSTSGKGYTMNLITDKNIGDYVKEIPDYFYSLQPAHQADFVRVNVICDNGGIWLDSDTIVMEALDRLFEFLETGNGFFIKENNQILWNGIFGSKPKTPVMMTWKTEMLQTLQSKRQQIGWTEIGNSMLQGMFDKNRSLYDGYMMLGGLDNVYPVNWSSCVEEFVSKPYDNYKNIVREFQPVVTLVNSVYKTLEDRSEQEILEGNMPLNYFLKKSMENK